MLNHSHLSSAAFTAYAVTATGRRWVISPTQKIQKGILSEAVPYFRLLAHQQKTHQWNGKLSCENIPEEVEAGEGRVPT